MGVWKRYGSFEPFAALSVRHGKVRNRSIHPKNLDEPKGPGQGA